MRIFPYLALLWQSGALFTRPPIEKIYDVIITPLTTTSTASSSTYTVATLSQSRDASTTTFSYSTLITMAPVSRNPLELRQRCFDDRGFSVDCATWTGYYCKSNKTGAHEQTLTVLRHLGTSWRPIQRRQWRLGHDKLHRVSQQSDITNSSLLHHLDEHSHPMGGPQPLADFFSY